ncbi:transporter, EamA family, partial [human gut metagenome]
MTLFEAYRYTTVAVATLCTYLNPIIIVFGAAILMHEQLTARKLLCIAVALIGMVFVSGVADSGLPTAGEAKGILLGLLTAVLYGCIVLSNKQLRDISAYDRTLVQLFITTLVL